MTTLAAVACLVALLVVAAVAWRRSRLDHTDLDSYVDDWPAEWDLSKVVFASDEDGEWALWHARYTPSVFDAVLRDFPTLRRRFSPMPKWADLFGIDPLFEPIPPPCPVCGAGGTDPCRTLTTGRATSGHRGRS